MSLWMVEINQGTPEAGAHQGPARGSVNSVPGVAGTATSPGNLPLHFEPNRGQADPQARFLARGPGYTLFLTASQAVFEKAPALVEMKVLGAAPDHEAVGFEPLEGKSHYLVGSDPADWITDVPQFRKVRYHEIYPGIDLVFSGTDGRLEYDFVVDPGFDPSTIELGFEGVEGARLDEAGNLVLTVVGGEVLQRRPIVYQIVDGHRQPVDGAFTLSSFSAGLSIANEPAGDAPAPSSTERPAVAGVEVGFDVGVYDSSLPLVIDPVLVYSTYFGSTGSDLGASVATDSAGNVYIAGQVSAADFPTTGFVPGMLTGAFISKLNPAGSAIVYSTLISGGSLDQATAVAVDDSGNAYLAGITQYEEFPTLNAFQGSRAGQDDGFVAKLNAAGSALVFSTFLGGTADEQLNDIVLDSSGNVYVTGETRSTDFPTQNPYQGANAGGSHDAFFTKLTGSGAMTYSSYLGGSSEDRGRGVAVDDSGNVYLTGKVGSADFPTLDAYQKEQVSGIDTFVTKLNAAGSAIVYSTYFGGYPGSVEALDIAVDSSANAYITGSAQTADLPTANAYQPESGGGTDGFVSKFSASGSVLVQSTYLGGTAEDIAYALALDESGGVLVAGSTRSLDFPTVGAVQAAKASASNGRDGFASTLGPHGRTLVFSTYLGGSDDDEARGLALDPAGFTYVVGRTLATDFPTRNAFEGSRLGSYDAFVAKLGSNLDFFIAADEITPPQQSEQVQVITKDQ
jgi:hypothetical protein